MEECGRSADVAFIDVSPVICGGCGSKAGSLVGDAEVLVREAVLCRSDKLDTEVPIVRGYDFQNGTVDYDALLQAMLTTGFQASHFGRAVQEVNRMISWRLSDEAVEPDCSPEHRDPAVRSSVKSKIFLGFTSNLISSGIRETIRFLAQHKLVDVLVTTAGGIEEDLIKCIAPTYVGDFSLSGKSLRAKGLNRIGNLLVPNDNYCLFEDWVHPILDKLVAEQREQKINWTPSKVIARLGKEINHPDSYLYWAQKNGIPVYCPALTDGSLGDMIYFHSFKNPGLVIDIVEGEIQPELLWTFYLNTSGMSEKRSKSRERQNDTKSGPR
ncbi:hypothetical protein CBR_g31495 [Chara braunii]|uniref:Deoxyhypusine synthase n=1 Tax=Chara braunii TaxID=69332 RepID=A0A388LF46_CHABU|nr:hypothetical protein CBR_g31495 [Chara braunii]|eukprot:GBG80939.1 hypothetical protein CBR_g31495 [Chara braunii]